MTNFTQTSSHRGFGLVELVITLGIVAVLAVIGIPLYQDYVIRARVSEALEFADAERTRVDPALMQGRQLSDSERDLLGARQVDLITGVQWVPTSAAAGFVPPTGSLGYILVSMKLPGLGEKSALALQRTPNGSWICLSAAKVGKPDALEQKYLPSTCQGDGTALAFGAPTVCPPDQDMVTLSTAGKVASACTPKCIATQTRDQANPTQCNGPVAPAAAVAPATTAVAVVKPVAAVPTAKPAALAAASPAPKGTSRRPGAAGEASIQCHVCDPAAPELCELVTVETTCAVPNNFCMTFVDNHADGTKTVLRGCGNFDRAWREWWQGTSDDDKCRERIDIEQHLDFTCTFACEKDNCNQSGRSLRPDEDSLYQQK